MTDQYRLDALLKAVTWVALLLPCFSGCGAKSALTLDEPTAHDAGPDSGPRPDADPDLASRFPSLDGDGADDDLDQSEGSA